MLAHFIAGGTRTTGHNTVVGCPVMGRTSQEVGVMPKEVIHRTGNDCFADVMVRWTKQGSSTEPSVRGGDARVDLFMISQRIGVPAGSFWFEPDDPESQGLQSKEDGKIGPLVGPISVDLNREQINRLIRTLRKARDQAYGADA